MTPFVINIMFGSHSPPPPIPGICRTFTSYDVLGVGHFLFAGCPRLGSLSDSSITFIKHMVCPVLHFAKTAKAKYVLCANAHTHAILLLCIKFNVLIVEILCHSMSNPG